MVTTEGDEVVVAFSLHSYKPDGMGEFGVSGFFAAAKMPHLSDDKTVAKMGHPDVACCDICDVLMASYGLAGNCTPGDVAV